MGEQSKVPARRPVPELIAVGDRTLSSHGWRLPLVEEHLHAHLSFGPSRKWCSIDCLARTFFGRNSPTHRDAVRRRLSRAFRVLLTRQVFLVIEYAQGTGAHGEAIACKFYQSDTPDEREYASAQLRRMHQRHDLTKAQVAAAEALLG